MPEETYNPIVERRQLAMLKLGRPPLPQPGQALVLHGSAGYLDTLGPDRATSGRSLWRRARLAYFIDLTDQNIAFEATVPAAGDAFTFDADVDLTCRVDEPHVIVDRNITDVARTLRPLVVDTMRAVSRRFDAEASAAAERAVATEIRSTDYRVGIAIVRFVVRLSLEQSSGDHLRTLRGLAWEQQEGRASSAVARARTRQELDLDQMKVDHYRKMLAAGQWNQLALQLAQRPDDVAEVVSIVRNHHASERQALMDQLEFMYQRDGFEGFDLEPAAQIAIKRLSMELGSVEGGHVDQLGSSSEDVS